MFSREDLSPIGDDQLTSWLFVGRYPGLYYTTYPQHAFCVPDSEQLIRITKAPRLSGDTGLRFWLSSEWVDGWSGRESYFSGYIRNSAFEQLSEAEFDLAVAAASADLLSPLKLMLPLGKGRFVGALQMCSMKTDFIISIFAEYEDEFVHFYWETTA